MIRQAAAADAQRIAEIYNHYIAESIATFELEPVSATDMAARVASVQRARLPWIVALDRQQNLLGYAYAGPWNARSAYKQTAEVSVYLDPSATSQGLGSALYATLFGQLRSLDLHVAIGVISLPNPASIALHEKFGMSKVGCFTEVGYKFGNWVDVGYWQITL